MMSDKKTAIQDRQQAVLAKMQENRAAVAKVRADAISASVTADGHESVMTVDEAVEALEKTE